MCHNKKHKVGGCHIEHPGSDIDEHYYDAGGEEEPDEALTAKREEYYRNNQFAGVTNGWRCLSLLPMGHFLQMLDKNGQ